MSSWQRAALEQVLGQLDSDLFQQIMRGIGQEGTETFQAGRWLIGIKSQGRQEGGTFQQMAAQVLEEAAPSQTLVDGGFEQGAPVAGFASLLGWGLRPRRQEVEEPLPP